jgi:fructosamine-3-kinase
MDWQLLGMEVARQLNLAQGSVAATPQAGGDINRAFRFELGARCFFVKTNRAGLLPMFEAERVGLETISATKTIRVPQVYLAGCQGDRAYIVMEYIELGGRADPGQLASALAAMHGCRHRQFGFECDNTIGSTPQCNSYCGDWLEFWRRHRLGYQLQLAERNGFGAGLIDAGNRLSESLACFFGGYQPFPSLLHGDLWSGNQAADAAGNPVIYDPACYYGDHEADLAMMELFGHPGEAFFARYRDHFPIDSGYRLRRDLYNLYHLLNHANLFGGGYPGQAQAVIERLLAQVR